MNDTFILCKVFTSLAKINFLEGDFNASIAKALEANKICKSVKLWPELILVTINGLLQLKKYENGKRFLSQIY